MTYKGSGVDYGAMDPFKRLAQLAAKGTAGNIARLMGGAIKEYELSRGESVYLIEMLEMYIAQVEEGLGTKNRVADAMYILTGKSYYDHIAQCAVAMIVNDMITLGALPLSVAMHLAVGSSDWFDDQQRVNDLVSGWKKACDLARCVWGCGETPTLKGIINPGTAVIAGSAVGIIAPKDRLITGDIQHGDAIVILPSSGVHANGLTMCGLIGERKDGFWRRFGNLVLPRKFPLKALPKGYLTTLSDGRTYGETLLDPTRIYVDAIEGCLNAGIHIPYTVNVTGHAWRKLMRHPGDFTYVVDKLPPQLPIFDFLQTHGPIDDREAYGNFNMGAGFVLYVRLTDAEKTVAICRGLGHEAFVAGYVEAGEKKVVIRPKNLEFAGDTLAVR